jgi:geranylgeranyl diphosphate synthase type II|tara:strand:- start:1240 stop:2109 length:870 start_codon:yes stop_codon:yes gene_type:complete
MLKEFMSHIRDQVSSNIEKYIGDSNFIEGAMKYSALAESKMFRAALVFASGDLNNNISNKSLINLSTSIELMHTYSLIHDDLPSMDNDELRRGQDSSHVKFGEANAILVGDALQALSYEIISDDEDLSSDEKVVAIKLLASACGKNGMVYGQFLDIESESKSIDKQSIENIHALKTGKLIECSVMYGQIGNPEKNVKKVLKSYAKKIGLAFQIKDDILEVTSNKETLGKNTNSDQKNHKSTYANILGIDKAKEKTMSLCEDAIGNLETLCSNKVNMLIELAKYIAYREK